MTGAPMPPGADTVVMVEDTESIGDDGLDRRLRAARWHGDPSASAMVVAVGEVVISAGTVLRPPHLGVLAELGYRSVARNFRSPQGGSDLDR